MLLMQTALRMNGTMHALHALAAKAGVIFSLFVHKCHFSVFYDMFKIT